VHAAQKINATQLLQPGQSGRKKHVAEKPLQHQLVMLPRQYWTGRKNSNKKQENDDVGKTTAIEIV
jgi:hypothetical protein